MADDDAISLSSASGSSSEASSSEEIGFDDEDVKQISAEDPFDNYWRQAIFACLILIGATAVFSTFIPILNQENDRFSDTVSLSISRLSTRVSISTLTLPD